MDANQYERLVRRIYSCDKTYSNGADGSIYIIMENAYHLLKTNQVFQRQVEKETEFRKYFSEIRRYVKRALEAGIERIQSQASPELLADIRNMISMLDMRFYDKKGLDLIILKADQIFRRCGMDD